MRHARWEENEIWLEAKVVASFIFERLGRRPPRNGREN